jgi:hypothetical protein
VQARLRGQRRRDVAQTQLRTHRLRWYYKYEFVMMFESIGFREIVVQCGSPTAFQLTQTPTWLSLPSGNMTDESLPR